MGAAPSEYDAVIADLENQILELQNTVDTLKRLREKGSSAGEAVTPAPRRTPVLRATPEGEPEFPSDFFMKMRHVPALRSFVGVRESQEQAEAYFDDMKDVISEMHRVCKPGAHAAIVIGNAYIKKEIETDEGENILSDDEQTEDEVVKDEEEIK